LVDAGSTNYAHTHDARLPELTQNVPQSESRSLWGELAEMEMLGAERSSLDGKESQRPSAASAIAL